MGKHRSRRGVQYSLYVSDGGRDRHRRRRLRLRWSLVVVSLALMTAGVSLAAGWAQDLWGRLAEPAAGRGPAVASGPVTVASPTSSPSAVPSATATLAAPIDLAAPIEARGDGVKVGTFLGDETRRVYGLGPPPKSLHLIWKTYVGGGLTAPVEKVTRKHPNRPWYGSGWTGQPVIVRDKGKLYLLWGAFDRKLHKIDLATGKVVWEYAFDDIIKSSPTVIEDPRPGSSADRYLVLAGSRRGWPSSFADPALAPYRAVSFGTGKEVWRLPVPLTASYSRDVDGSGFFSKGRLYTGVESGWVYKIDPFTTRPWNGHRTPEIVAGRLLLGTAADRATHAGNLVLEASPCLLDDVVFVSSGAGHVYGLRRSDLRVVWDYRTGSDLDGTPVPTMHGKLLVPVEKQYISGHGGILMLDPSKEPSQSVVWFFPTGDRKLGDWQGGVVGSVAVNDAYDPSGRRPRLAAFTAIDGNLYVVSQNTTSGIAAGPNGDGPYPTPKLIARFSIGGSISTPIMVDDTIVAAGYDDTIHLYRISYKRAEKDAAGALRSPAGGWYTVSVTEKDRFVAGGSFESTPVMWKRRVIIGCRDGSLYCVGDR